jgi:hypothetical protein
MPQAESQQKASSGGFTREVGGFRINWLLKMGAWVLRLYQACQTMVLACMHSPSSLRAKALKQ